MTASNTGNGSWIFTACILMIFIALSGQSRRPSGFVLSQYLRVRYQTLTLAINTEI